MVLVAASADATITGVAAEKPYSRTPSSTATLFRRERIDRALSGISGSSGACCANRLTMDDFVGIGAVVLDII
jgi:hypothetical protein